MTNPISSIGLDSAIKKMERAADPATHRRGLKKGGRAVLKFILADMPGYPQPRPGQKYIRTHRLERSYRGSRGFPPGALGHIRIMGGTEIETIFGTTVPYAQYVIGRGTQAWMHKGRWWVFQRQIEKRKPEARRLMRDEYFAEVAK